MAANFFNIGDVLSFQYPDKTYGVTVLVKINIIKGLHDYEFCRTTYKSEKEFVADDIKNIKVIGYNLPFGNKLVWCIVFVKHSWLKKYVNNFKKIGSITLKDGSEEIIGGEKSGYTFELFCEGFNEIVNNQWSNVIEKEIPIKEFIK